MLTTRESRVILKERDEMIAWPLLIDARIFLMLSIVNVEEVTNYLLIFHCEINVSKLNSR